MAYEVSSYQPIPHHITGPYSFQAEMQYYKPPCFYHTQAGTLTDTQGYSRRWLIKNASLSSRHKVHCQILESFLRLFYHFTQFSIVNILNLC